MKIRKITTRHRAQTATPKSRMTRWKTPRVVPVVLLLQGGLFYLGGDTALGAFSPSGLLEIHYINVGQGGSTLILGPDGTTILYDFGKRGQGTLIAKYLDEKVKLRPENDALHFTILSHRDSDHYGGYKGVIEAGYDVLVANFGPGSSKTASNMMKTSWLTPAESTGAGAVQPIPVGLRIPLGDGAEAFVVAANGNVFRNPNVPRAGNENDKSVALYVHYKGFDYILDGDLGAGPEACSGHETSQRNFQVPVAKALMDLEWMKPEFGVDVLHIAHHGSESSTSAAYYKLMKPEVGLISVGLDQGMFRHPRTDVVENVLLGEPRLDCLDNTPALLGLFQTEDGLRGKSSTGSTSFEGTTIGDIKLVTDGRAEFRIFGTGRTANGETDEIREQGWCFPMDSRETEEEACP